MAFATSADYVIAPLQDLMHLDDEARFNTPGTTVGNWIWRLQSFDNKLEGAIKGYGEEEGSGAVILLVPQTNRIEPSKLRIHQNWVGSTGHSNKTTFHH